MYLFVLRLSRGEKKTSPFFVHPPFKLEIFCKIIFAILAKFGCSYKPSRTVLEPDIIRNELKKSRIRGPELGPNGEYIPG